MGFFFNFHTGRPHSCLTNNYHQYHILKVYTVCIMYMYIYTNTHNHVRILVRQKLKDDTFTFYTYVHVHSYTSYIGSKTGIFDQFSTPGMKPG